MGDCIPDPGHVMPLTTQNLQNNSFLIAVFLPIVKVQGHGRGNKIMVLADLYRDTLSHVSIQGSNSGCCR